MIAAQSIPNMMQTVRHLLRLQNIIQRLLDIYQGNINAAHYFNEEAKRKRDSDDDDDDDKDDKRRNCDCCRNYIPDQEYAVPGR